MSGEAAPVTESAPQSTQDIAASVIQEAEHESSSSEETGGYEAPARVDTTNAVETPEAKAEPLTKAELSAAAKFLREQGHEIKKIDGRPNWLPLSTVEGMLDRYAGQHRQTWDGERTVYERQLTDARTAMEQFRAGISGDPRVFLSELAAHDARYKPFLEPAPQAERPSAPSAPSAEMPAPDLRLPDGSSTYSLDGLKALLEWNTQQVEAKLLPKLDERLKPWEERDKASQQERDQAVLRERTSKQMQDAQAWAMFGAISADGSLTPFQTEVLAELEKDTQASKAQGRRPMMTLRQAYLEVFTRHQEPDKVRERLMADTQKARPDPALARQTTDAPRKTGPRSTADIAREQMVRLERGA